MKSKFRFLTVFAISILLMSITPVFAALVPIDGVFLNDQLNFTLNGKTVIPTGDDGTPVLPITYNATTYLPVRAMAYMLNLGISYDGATKTVMISSTTDKQAPSATNPIKTNELIPIKGAVLNSDLKFSIDGKSVTPVDNNGKSVLPISYNGTTYLPVRAMANLLGIKIGWDGPTRTISLEKKSAPGLYLVKVEFEKYAYDTDEMGGKPTVSPVYGGHVYEYSHFRGGKNDFYNDYKRAGADGSTIFAAKAHTIWEDPPSYIPYGARPSIKFERTVEHTEHTSPRFRMYIVYSDGSRWYRVPEDVAIPEGKSRNDIDYNYSGELQIDEDGFAARFDIVLNVVMDGYTFKYYYQWRD